MINDIKASHISETENTKIATKDNKKKKRVLIYLLIFLYALHLSPAMYIESSFLESLIGGKSVGLIYSLASFFTIFALFLIRLTVSFIGNYRTFRFALWVEIIALFVLSISLFVDKNPPWTFVFIIAFIISFVARSISFFNFDIFLERLSDSESTGTIRGVFLTSMNFAILIGPLLAGLLVSDVNDIGKVFILGIIIMLPIFYLSKKHFKNFEDPKYKQYKIYNAIIYVLKRKELRMVFWATLILNVFYAWMVIYTPIYLNTVIGFNLGTVATLIGIGLIPFLLLQFFLGNLADKKFGEKEIMTLGFIIAGFSTIAFGIYNERIFWIWALILFLTRVGASMVETMVETHIFKKINSDDLDVIGLFRALRPVSFIISPIIASIILFFSPMYMLFIILGAVLILSIYFSLSITDTK